MSISNCNEIVRSLRFRLSLLCPLALLLIGCGPVFDTVYDMSPPASATGKTCVYQCDNGKLQCEELVEMKYDNCEINAERKQELCRMKLENQGKEEKWYDCPLDSCSKDDERCERQYRSCYQSCGGKVTSRRVCVMNCDKIGQAGTGDDS